ncbi:hypothetical protein EYC80_008404 [Monilinia laxa]|uniref:DUF676 domain-containing protein n=1 Tax=Monilinia laxa TaxID=61186 RepID=A0A5N6JRX2_MONLA|nr:hypothetical protein EYC80_008404 [Monilinia laxa]
MRNADPKVSDIGRAIEDDFATIKDCYATPKNPIVLAHGLFGFDEFRIAGSLLPAVQYWRGITDALRAKGIEVIIASVPASGSIEERAAVLGQGIAAKANGKSVNIIAHSMGGLDARFMISRLQPQNVEVLSLTTIATPHRGSAFADYCLDESWWHGMIPGLIKKLNEVGISTGAFTQLTRKYMREEFNPKTPDDKSVRYFSYGATCDPKIWSAFRKSHGVVQRVDGPNDGLIPHAAQVLQIKRILPKISISVRYTCITLLLGEKLAAHGYLFLGIPATRREEDGMTSDDEVDEVDGR